MSERGTDREFDERRKATHVLARVPRDDARPPYGAPAWMWFALGFTTCATLVGAWKALSDRAAATNPTALRGTSLRIESERAPPSDAPRPPVQPRQPYPAGPASDCTTPFTLDDNGNKHWRPECVR